MSLSITINKAKVEELLNSSGNRYVVSTSDVPTAEPTMENCSVVYPSSEVSGTVYVAPVVVAPETRDGLMSARRKIEESGVPLKSADELSNEIEKMRGRSG